MLDQKQKLYTLETEQRVQRQKEISVFQIKSPISGVKKMVTERSNGKWLIYLLTPKILADVMHRTKSSRVTINILLMDFCYPHVDQCLAV